MSGQTANNLPAVYGAGAVTSTKSAQRRGIQLPPQHALTAEHLHKDELQYELEARGVSIESSNVATVRTIFRTSRDLKENSATLANNEILKDPASVLSFCRQRFNQIKDLVDNTTLVAVCQTWV
jgi:hypothetical protein